MCVIIGGNIIRVSSFIESPSAPVAYKVLYRGKTFTVGPTPRQADSNSNGKAKHGPGEARQWLDGVMDTTASVACPRASLPGTIAPPPSSPSTSSAATTPSPSESPEPSSPLPDTRQTNLGSLISHYAYSSADPKRGIFMADAATRGDIEVLLLLRSLGCSFSEGDRFVTKLSFAAALNYHLPVLDYLCSEGVLLIREVSPDGNSLAHIAASQNNVPLLDLVYSQWKASVHPALAGSSLPKRLLTAHPDLYEEAESMEMDRHELVRYMGLLHNNRTPSMIAGLYRHLDTLKWLRNHGDPTLDFAEPQNIGAGLLHLSLENGDVPMLCWLLDCGIPIKYRFEDGGTLATMSARYGKVQLLELLLKRGADWTLANYAGESPFLVAASYGHVGVLEWMERQGYLMEDRTNLGRSALHVAAAGGQLQVIEWLHSRGMSIHDKTYLGYTASCMAAKEGHLHILKWLHAHGDQLSDVVVDGTTPLLQATFYGHLHVIKWLHRLGYSLSDRYQDGMTVVHTAAIKGQLGVLQWLASKGYSMVELTDSGMTPASLAYAHGNADVWLWLRENGLSASH